MDWRDAIEDDRRNQSGNIRSVAQEKEPGCGLGDIRRQDGVDEDKTRGNGKKDEVDDCGVRFMGADYLMCHLRGRT